MLDERREPDHELAKCLRRAVTLERREAVECNALRLKLLDDLLNLEQPVLEPLDFRIVTDHTQQSVLLHRLEICAPARRITEQLRSAFLEREQQAALANGRATPKKLRHR